MAAHTRQEEAAAAAPPPQPGPPKPSTGPPGAAAVDFGVLKRVAGWLSPPMEPGEAARSGPAIVGAPLVKAELHADPGTGMDRSTIEFLIVSMLSGQAHLQRYVVENYCMPAVELVHIQGSVRGRKNYYHAFRAATRLVNYHVTVHDTVITDDKAVAWLTMEIRLRSWLPMIRRGVPIIVWFRFEVDPEDGRTKVALQYDHFTLEIVDFIGGRFAAQLHQAVLKPALGWAMVGVGALQDRVQLAMSGLQSRGPVAALAPAASDTAGAAGRAPHEIDRAMRAEAARVGEQLLFHPSDTRGLSIAGPGGAADSWLAKAADMIVGLAGLPGWMFTQALGMAWALLGPLPVLLP